MSAPLTVSSLDEKKLVSLVSEVTSSICGVAFSLASHVDPAPWLIATLPISGGRPITVGIVSDEAGCRALASGMLQCPPATLDRALIEDTIREILNMVAGQVKTAMSLDQALGLPRIISADKLDDRLRVPDKRVGMASGALALTLMIASGTY